MASAMDVDGAPPRRRKTALERRQQKFRAETRCLLHVLKGLNDLDNHRGSELSHIGQNLQREVAASIAKNGVVPTRVESSSTAPGAELPSPLEVETGKHVFCESGDPW